MLRLYVVVIEVEGKEVLRTEPLDQTLANIRIKEWIEEHWDPRAVIWKETQSQPYILPAKPGQIKRREDLSEQEKTVKKYL